MQNKKFSVEIGGKTLTAEFPNLAEQAHGSALARLGDTVILATAVMSEHTREGIDYFPLTVDYEERFYAAGMILGSRFIRREGRPSEEAILISRLIDRGLRPLFNQKIRNEVQVVALALSFDGENEPDIPALLASSLALGTSSVPWGGPLASLRIGRVDGKFILNPLRSDLEKSDMDMVVSWKDGKINMLEAGTKEISEEDLLQALNFAQTELQKLEEFQKNIIQELGKEKVNPEIKEEPAALEKIFEEDFREGLEKGMYPGEKKERSRALDELKKKWDEALTKEIGEEYLEAGNQFWGEKLDKLVHENIIKYDRRPDGRGLKEIRPLAASVGILPRTHGSGLFYRGETHVLSLATLGGPQDTQLVEGMSIRTKKRFMHHYNFPPFAPGETGRMGSPGRREIGHGALVERALLPVMPEIDEFPYTIRVVSEVLSSNGSTSMASTCALSLALMDAGVPIKRPVAGISMGLMLSEAKSAEGGIQYKILTDIQGFEDHWGDMDFKVTGTQKGVTAIQLDIKIDGVTFEILKEALGEAKEARAKIMAAMLEAIPAPRAELSPLAPRILSLKINPEKIRELIGPGGKMINSIIDETGAQVDVEQDGMVYITGQREAAERALEKIKEVTHEYQVGETFEGAVSRIFDFGAMVEFAPREEGLVHISELAPFHVNRVEDVVNIGDRVPVKIISIDELGRINLSIKDLTSLKPKEGVARGERRERSFPGRPSRPSFGRGGHGRPGPRRHR